MTSCILTGVTYLNIVWSFIVILRWSGLFVFFFCFDGSEAASVQVTGNKINILCLI